MQGPRDSVDLTELDWRPTLVTGGHKVALPFKNGDPRHLEKTLTDAPGVDKNTDSVSLNVRRSFVAGRG